MKKTIIFTDLDGTLLDSETYSFEEALPALKLLRERHIPLIICSSKTRAEIEYYRKLLENHDPFISENGGGIYIPRGYFPFRVEGDFIIEERNGYTLLRLGADYARLRECIYQLRASGFNVTGFGDLGYADIQKITGLPAEQAKMAKEREFDEPFIIKASDEEKKIIIGKIKEMGFQVTEGRLMHLIGGSDKGRAVSILKNFYEMAFGAIITIALGDSPNDTPMLLEVDKPAIVEKENGLFESRIKIPNLMRAAGKGPSGWNIAIYQLLGRIII